MGLSQRPPVRNLAELAAYARSRPGQLNYGSAGAGGINHLVLEQFNAHAGVSIVHVPYRGVAPAAVDAMAGQIQVLTGTVPALAPLIRDERLKALPVLMKTGQGIGIEAGDVQVENIFLQ